MKNPMQKLRRLFVSTRRYQATATRAASAASFDEDDGSSRLSGAFIIVLLLHVIAVAGVFAFARIKENRSASNPQDDSASKQAAAKPAAKTQSTKPDAAKGAVAPATTAGAQPRQAAPPASESLKSPAGGTHAVHIVKDGETLSRIAFAYNVGVPEIVTANKLKSQDDIRPGQVLNLPDAKQGKAADAAKLPAPAASRQAAASATPAKPSTTEKKPLRSVTVRKGETIVKIARDNGCSYEELVKLNNIKDPKKIQPGQVLKLPSKNS